MAPVGGAATRCWLSCRPRRGGRGALQHAAWSCVLLASGRGSRRGRKRRREEAAARGSVLPRAFPASDEAPLLLAEPIKRTEERQLADPDADRRERASERARGTSAGERDSRRRRDGKDDDDEDTRTRAKRAKGVSTDRHKAQGERDGQREAKIWGSGCQQRREKESESEREMQDGEALCGRRCDRSRERERKEEGRKRGRREGIRRARSASATWPGPRARAHSPRARTRRSAIQRPSAGQGG